MKIVQLIDSLASGGAERMAVNFANGIAEETGFCGLVVTRNEGPLKKMINDDVEYLFLDRKKVIDIKSLLKFKNFIRTNNITIIHAHGTSYFFSILLKIIYPSIKIVWHEHLGARANQKRVQNWLLILSSFFFTKVLVVNHQLEAWMKKNLLVNKVSFFPNFAIADTQNRETVLKGNSGKRILCLANLKHPKNHIVLLEAFSLSRLFDQGWTIHFVGKDFNDQYSKNLQSYISESRISEYVFFYGEKNDVQFILKQATIGVLCSTEEGFPVILLEYGLASLPVLTSSVGYCAQLIENDHNGLLFNPSSVSELQSKLQKLTEDNNLRDRFAQRLHQLVLDEYSKTTIIKNLVSNFNSLTNGK